jgi:hypothetical protein
MGVPRFFRVLRGQRGQAAKDKYLAYLTQLNSGQEGLGTKGNRPDRVLLYLKPYNVDLGTDAELVSSALEPSWNQLRGLTGVSTRVSNVGTANTVGVKLRSAKPARVHVTTGLVAQGTVDTSQLTGLKYLKYGGTGASIPFGRSSGTDTMGDGYTQIKNSAIATFGARTRVSLSEEQI